MLGALPSQAFAGGWVFNFPAPFSADGSNPRLAMTQAGEAVIAYEGFNDTIRISRHPPNGDFSGGVFGEAVFPEPATCCLRPEAPAVAIDPAGDIIVVWQQGLPGSDNPEIYASFRPHDGSFSSPQAISFENATSPEVAIDADGEATVVWLRNDGTSTIVEAATSMMGGPFSSPLKLSGDGGNAAEAQVATDPEGDAIASWIRTSGSRSNLEVAVRRSGGYFPSPGSGGDGVVLGESKAPSTKATGPPAQHIVMNSGPEAMAVWQTSDSAVQVARLTRGSSSFGTATTLGATSVFPSIAMDEAGEAVVDWPVASGIDVATAAPAAAFGPPEQIALPEGAPEFAKVSVAPTGAVTLAWLSSPRESDGFWSIADGGTVRPPGGVFATPLTGGVDSTGEARGDLEMAGDSLGDTLAVCQEASTIGNHVSTFVYDNGPTLTGVNVPSAAQVGQPVSFSVAPPVTLWQPLTSVTWDFGDGTSASGISATHIYKTPGIYDVTLSAADAQHLPPPLPEKHLENTVSQAISISAVAGASQVLTDAPTITGARESHRAWREGSALASAARRKKGLPIGTVFSYRLNEPADVHFAFTQLLGAPKTRGKCTPYGKRRQHQHRCRRTVAAGTMSFPGHAGANKLSFHGRLSSTRSLKPGRYSLTITASNSSGHSASQLLRFTIAG